MTILNLTRLPSTIVYDVKEDLIFGSTVTPFLSRLYILNLFPTNSNPTAGLLA
jgi:hypothetical protein